MDLLNLVSTEHHGRWPVRKQCGPTENYRCIGYYSQVSAGKGMPGGIGLRRLGYGRCVSLPSDKKFRYRFLYAVAQLVEALRYKPEGRGFDS
jgi:hypothetical protein